MVGTTAIVTELYRWFNKTLFQGEGKLAGRLYHAGTRQSIGDQDGVLQSLSSSPAQFSSADIALYIYCNDIENGSNLLVKDTKTLGIIEEKICKLFPEFSNTVCLKNMKVRMTFLNTEARTNLKQHCVSAVFAVTWVVDPRKV